MNHLKDFLAVDTRPAAFDGLLRSAGAMAALCIALFLLLFIV